MGAGNPGRRDVRRVMAALAQRIGGRGGRSVTASFSSRQGACVSACEVRRRDLVLARASDKNGRGHGEGSRSARPGRELGYAASWYSLISPPSRPRRRSRSRSITSAIACSPGGGIARAVAAARVRGAAGARCSAACRSRDVLRGGGGRRSGAGRGTRGGRCRPQRSACARASGARTGALITRTPSERKTSSNSRVNLLSRSQIRKRGYAASRYSWISPPSRSRRRTRSRSMTSAIACSSLGGSLLSGGRCPSARCGRCSL